MRYSIMVMLALFATTNVIADDAADAGAKVYEYFEAFNQKDTNKIATTIYSMPVHIGGGTGHRIYADASAAVASLPGFYEQIEADGWVESRISDLKICMASETLALVDTRFSRLDQNGETMPPAIRTTLYILQKIEEDWRIVAFYGHDNDSRPGCDQG